MSDMKCLELPVTSPFDHLQLETLKQQDVYNIKCMSLNGDSKHSVTLFNQNISSGKLVVQPIAASTRYECFIQHNNETYSNISANFTTCSSFSLVLAGIIGGLVGVVISVLIIAGITGVIFGTMILARRKR